MTVDEEAGDGRVPGCEGRVGAVAAPFRLKEDMLKVTRGRWIPGTCW